MRNLKTSGIFSLRFSILLIAAVLCITTTTAQQDVRQWKDYVGTSIDSLLKNDLFCTSQVGICIYDLTADSLIYSYNERQTMRPASTEKLITAITALDVLGAGYRLNTEISYTGNITDGTLNGNLFCKGSADPLITLKDIVRMAADVKTYGIDTIRGSIYFDKSVKDNSELGEGWCWDDDNPSLSALTVNGNDIFCESFVQALRDTAVILDADINFSICPDTAKIISSTSHTIMDILPRMMKESDNLHAESVFYNIAATRRNKWATAKDAAAVIDSIARRLGHRKSEYRIADGSGLSLYNYTTPEIEISFLRHAYSKKDIYEVLYLTLPVAGLDGTLKRRMRNNAYARGNVRAKTGSLSGVSSLAGYCRAANHHDIAFCIINQGVLRSKRARDFQDKVCAILCEPYEENFKKQ